MHDGEYYYIKSHKNTFQLVGHHIQCPLTIRNTNDFDFMVQQGILIYIGLEKF